MSDSHDNILTAFLREMLGNERPQRSAVEIVRHAHAANDHEAADSPPEGAMPRTPGIVAATRIVVPSTPLPEMDEPVSENPSRHWVGIAGLAAALILTTGLVVWFLINESGIYRPLVVQNDPPSVLPENESIPSVDNDSLVQRRKKNQPANRNRRQPVSPLPEDGQSENPRIADTNLIPPDQTALVLPPAFARGTRPDTIAVTPVVAAISANQKLANAWRSSGLEPVEALELDPWIIRLSTRLLGRTPTADELSALSEVVAGRSGGEARGEVVRWLLDGKETRQQFAEHWGRVLAWKMLGLGQSLETTDIDMLRTQQFLSEQIAAEHALDETVYKLLSVVGSTNPDDDKFDPAASYLIGLTKRFGSREFATAHISETFLGKSLKCAQCHDSGIGQSSGLAGVSQHEFYELHSFFAQMRFEPLDNNTFFVVNRNFLPLGNQGQVSAPFNYTDSAGVGQTAIPKWQNLQPADNGFVAVVDRRSILAAAMVGSITDFRRAMVDQVWTRLLNVPMTGIDGIEESAAVEILEIRDELADQWAANDYQLSWLVQTIVLTDAFAVGVGSDEQLATNNPFLGAAPRFNQFYPRLENRRSATGSLAIVANAYLNRDPSEALSAGLLARIDGAGTAFPQVVIKAHLPTHDNQWATSSEITAKLDQIAASDLPPQQKVEHLVQLALGRRATDKEIEHGQQILQASQDQQTGLQDIWWSLLNCIEYQLPLAVR